MKICIIGDVHGRDIWQRIDFSEYDHVVFMGDYFDPYMGTISYDDRLENFEKIVNLKGKEPSKYTLLFGNHDYHYLDSISRFERYSRYDRTFAEEYPIAKMFAAGLEAETLQFAWKVPDSRIVFTHAGISALWYNRNILGRNISYSDDIEDIYPAVDDLDEMVEKINHAPLRCFGFVDIYWDSYGFAPDQGPLWWRVENRYGKGLQEGRLLGFTQVNGHTRQNYLSVYGEKPEQVAMVDILGNGKYVKLETKENGDYIFTEQFIPLTVEEKNYLD